MSLIKSEKIAMLKAKKLRGQNGRCAACGKLFKSGDKIELAHIIPQRKWIIKKYGIETIHHEMNMKLTHSGSCNSDVQIMPESLPALDLIRMIKEDLDERG